MAARDKPGVGRPVRVDDVARVAGVSPITVSRALATPEKVRPATRERVEAAVAATGYRVNKLASSLRSGRSSIITVFISSLMNPHFTGALQGTLDAIEASPYTLVFAQVGYSETVDGSIIEAAMPLRPAAVMLSGIVRNAEVRSALARMGVPVMEFWSDGIEPIDMLVGSSTHEGGRLMGLHFGESGFRRVAYSGHTLDRGAERLAGFREGLAEYGVSDVAVFPREGTRQVGEGAQVFDEILASRPDCDAVFFGTDLLAFGALVQARKRGIQVPRQLAIAGYGDLDVAEYAYPSLTSINVSSYKMGRRAGEMLLARLHGVDAGPKVVIQPVRLEIRDSTRR